MTGAGSHLLVTVGISVCVGVVALVWAASALSDRASRSASGTEEARPQSRPDVAVRNASLIGVTGLCAGVAIVAGTQSSDLTVRVLWVRILGLAVLAASSAFTVWARLALGRMWSVLPSLKGDHELRVNGPYAVTRHPVYTGGLGMLLGITLLGGIGRLIVLFPACLIVLEVKIRMEEQLLTANFPDDYPRYRRRVPQLVPGVQALRSRAPP